MDMKEIQRLAALAAQTENQSVAQAGFEYEVPPAGVALGRFVEYIELGRHEQGEYKGAAKAPAYEVRLTFELLTPKHIREIEIDGVATKVANRISLTITKKLGDKANFFKLMQKMLYGREGIGHMAMMLGEAFVLTVVHNKSTKDPSKTYANIKDEANGWYIAPPYKTDALSGDTTPYNVPAAMSPVKLFLWDSPTKETWDSIFIDGTRTVTEGDKSREVSKNWLQDKCMAALNFDGSALHQLVGGLADLTTDPLETAAQAAPVDPLYADLEEPAPKAAAKGKPAQQAAPKAPAKAPAPAEGADALAELGL